jgi:hypothetical protein
VGVRDGDHGREVGTRRHATGERCGRFGAIDDRKRSGAAADRKRSDAIERRDRSDAARRCSWSAAEPAAALG